MEARQINYRGFTVTSIVGTNGEGKPISIAMITTPDGQTQISPLLGVFTDRESAFEAASDYGIELVITLIAEQPHGSVNPSRD